MSTIDKVFVKKSFNSSAATYDRYAGLQKRMVERLMVFGDVEKSSVSRALDVGMGTGNLTEGLTKYLPAADVHGCDLALKMVLYAGKKLCLQEKKHLFLTADAEFLPYKDGSFDLIVSSFTYQWLEEWDRAFQEVKRVLAPGGTFVFSAFGIKTFAELRQSYRKACADTGYKQGEALELALNEEKIKKMILSCGFMTPFVRSFRIVETYQSVNDLIRSIKGMGARNASANRNKTFGVRKVWRKMVEFYERDFGTGDKIPATFEIIMAKGAKSRLTPEVDRLSHAL